MHLLSKMKLKSLKQTVLTLFNQREEGKSVDKREEIKANIELAKFYDQHVYDKDLPNSEIYALEAYRAAAVLGSPEAQYVVANRLIAKGRFWEDFANTDLYRSEIHKRYSKNYYDEGFSYLSLAEQVEYPLAIRLHGLACIRGWGIEKNTELGIRLVVNSIEKEGKWDKASEIVKKLGLDPQKFFSSWSTLKNKTK